MKARNTGSAGHDGLNHRGSPESTAAESCCAGFFQSEEKGGRTTCCGSESADFSMREMMQECAGRCRWLPLVAATFGALFLLLGILLSPDGIRAIWLVLSGMATVAGFLGLILMNRIFKTF